MAQTIYNPVDTAQGEIRLLGIQPARKHDAPLACFLFHAHLSQTPRYEALSYTWGNPGGGCNIQLNGQYFPVQENADAALRRLRQPTTTRTIWIDAICINQGDKREKDGQLVLMTNIYEQAEQVCIWLGEMTDTSQIGIDDLQSRVAKEYKMWSNSTANRVTVQLIGPSGMIHNSTNGVAMQNTVNLSFERDLGEIRELLNRRWWTRVWIMQEAIVARKLTLMCGPEKFEWDGIQRSVGRMRKHRGAVEVFGTIVNPETSMQDETYQAISRFRELWRERKWNVSIYELLYEFRHLGCTDPRDRVFGFLGLASATRDLGIVPDSTASISDVFAKSAKKIIEQTRCLEIFNCKREWKGVVVPPQPEFAYSLADQAKYHDVAAIVTDGPGTEARKGWARLPPGWERVQGDHPKFFSSWSKWKTVLAGKSRYFFDHNTGTTHEQSPQVLMGLPPSSTQHVAKQRILPPGWIKQWDGAGRPQVLYAPEKYMSQAQGVAKATLSGLPTWVPNWSARTHLDPAPLLDWSEETPRYWAAGQTTANLDMNQTSSRIIGVEGILFDEIDRMADPWHPTSETPPITRRGIPALETWETLALEDVNPCPYVDRGGRKTALWRTLITDYAGHRAEPDSGWSMVELWHDRTAWSKKLPSLDEMATMGIMSTATAQTEVTSLGSAMFTQLLDIDFGSASVFGSEKRYGRYLRRIHKVCSHRALFVTKRGYMGLAPWNAKPGDFVCVLKGGKTPFLLRPVPVIERYTLVGEAFVYGIMGSEALYWEHAQAATQMFYLV